MSNLIKNMLEVNAEAITVHTQLQLGRMFTMMLGGDEHLMKQLTLAAGLNAVAAVSSKETDHGKGLRDLAFCVTLASGDSVITSAKAAMTAKEDLPDSMKALLSAFGNWTPEENTSLRFSSQESRGVQGVINPDQTSIPAPVKTSTPANAVIVTDKIPASEGAKNKLVEKLAGRHNANTVTIVNAPPKPMPTCPLCGKEQRKPGALKVYTSPGENAPEICTQANGKAVCGSCREKATTAYNTAAANARQYNKLEETSCKKIDELVALEAEVTAAESTLQVLDTSLEKLPEDSVGRAGLSATAETFRTSIQSKRVKIETLGSEIDAIGEKMIALAPCKK